ncbi:hypothetical protein GWI33_017523 [Rhynchophorus ferrugineus]|uniref:Uncharacterized protein n=1 Tax=Rhynchophorus ferrugineus TaxID=354439 RepID=A0A834HY91_RHYFE|nr:hypothetical protein GWI33_017523 [Rhynchophorus ferrugineus]
MCTEYIAFGNNPFSIKWNHLLLTPLQFRALFDSEERDLTPPPPSPLPAPRPPSHPRFSPKTRAKRRHGDVKR